jgi:hypothetical protein
MKSVNLLIIFQNKKYSVRSSVAILIFKEKKLGATKQEKATASGLCIGDRPTLETVPYSGRISLSPGLIFSQV